MHLLLHVVFYAAGTVLALMVCGYLAVLFITPWIVSDLQERIEALERRQGMSGIPMQKAYPMPTVVGM
jgi:hypothetical protein